MHWGCVTSGEVCYQTLQMRTRASYGKELYHDLSQQGLLAAILSHFLKCLFKRESTADCGGVFITQ